MPEIHEHHEKAAHHHEQAAKHHREAAKHQNLERTKRPRTTQRSPTGTIYTRPSITNMHPNFMRINTEVNFASASIAPFANAARCVRRTITEDATESAWQGQQRLWRRA